MKLHLVLVPFMAQGHTIPMIDMACLLADRGPASLVTVVTTPANASSIKPIIDRIENSGTAIRFVELRFPATEFGLPDGCENVDVIPSRDLLKNFLQAAEALHRPLIKHLESCELGPSCIISDVMHPWTRKVAEAFHIPRFIFNGSNCFASLCMYNVCEQMEDQGDDVADENEPVVVPGLLERVELTRAKLPGSTKMPVMKEFRAKMRVAELAADGIIVNSFDGLEPDYSKLYEETTGKKVWMIGPLSMYNTDSDHLAARGNTAAIDEAAVLRWLDSMKPGSAVYVSFGSLANTAPSQLIEIGSGLEASRYPFIWVLKTKAMEEVEEWLKEFEERNNSKGLVIRGWAPQVTILNHPSVGGFVTHCGWNSAIESISAGVPMITWPLFAEQFINEKLIVDVLKIGVAVGVKSPTKWGVQSNEVQVKRSSMEAAMARLMGDEDDGKEIRERARNYRSEAQMAIQEGGSSMKNLTNLFQYILE